MQVLLLREYLNFEFSYGKNVCVYKFSLPI